MKILVRIPNWIGDAVMATPFLRALIDGVREDGSVSVWGPPVTAVLFHHFTGLEEVVVLDEKKEPERLQELRNKGFEKVFLLTNSFSTAKAAKAAGIPHRIGYRRQWRGFLLTKAVFCGPRIRNRHMVDYYLHLLPDEWKKEPIDKHPCLSCSPEETSVSREELAPLREFGRVVGMAPGAAYGPAKQWFPENFRELARRLSEDGFAPVVVGTDRERELGDFILEKVPSERRLNLAGRTNLRGLMAFIAEFDCLVCNDSGPMHIADALGTPVVAFFGSTDSAWTGPRSPGHRILQADVACNPCFLRECPLEFECMKTLTVARAEQAVRDVLGLRKHGSNRLALRMPEHSL